MTIAQILKIKGNNVSSLAPTATVLEAAQMLGAKRIGAVLVVDSAEGLVGILSERDIVGSLAQHGPKTLDMTVAELMTSEVQVASPRTTVEEAMGMMTQGRFRHVPVVEGGHLVGLVSIGDVVKARISDQEHEVDSLRAYVAGA